MSNSNTILEPSQFEILEDEVEEEQALTLLSSFFDKVWQRIDDEPSVDDYFNYM
jgi:hypothetical protein